MKDDIRLLPKTPKVHPDEKAWVLVEQNELGRNGKGFFRFQHVVVNRGDKLMVYTTNMGLVTEAPQFRIPSLWEHSVAELQEIADIERLTESEYWLKYAEEMRAESSLIPDFLNRVESNWATIENKSVFGPGIKRQRDGFPKRAVLDAAKARADANRKAFTR